MHEFSQTADLVDWKSTPYFYASADSTPLFVMAMEDYLNISGDEGFLRQHWDAVKRAWAFTRAHDSDGDGIYENTEGTGWVESWPPGMPHQEIYLAALDQQSCDAFARLAARMGDGAASADARRQAETSARTWMPYFDSAARFYAFSRNADGTLDRTATIYPSVAWWTRPPFARPMPATCSPAGRRTNSPPTGARAIISAADFLLRSHQLPPGHRLAALHRLGIARRISRRPPAFRIRAPDAERRPHLGAGSRRRHRTALGRILPAARPQQFASALVFRYGLLACVRGLFGLDWDAAANELSVTRLLPADWDHAKLSNIPMGTRHLDLEIRRENGMLLIHAIEARSAKPRGHHRPSDVPRARRDRCQW